MGWDKINRRRFVRVKFPFTVHIYFTGEPPISAYAEDVSAGGIRVTVQQPLKVSSLVDLELYVKLRPITCKGKVIWVNKRESIFLEGEFFFDIGMEFQDLTPEEREAIKERLDKIAREKKAKEEART